jgi:uncharacterized membrane protein YbhN (UPF0104 family)
VSPGAVILRLLVSAAAVGLVVWWALRQDAPALPTGFENIAALLIALAVYAAATAARAERWHRIVAAETLPATRGDTYRLTVLSYAANNALPARAGDVMRGVLLGRLAGTTFRRALGTVVAERVLDAAALAAVFAVCAWGVTHEEIVPGPVVGGVAAGGMLVLALGIGMHMWRAGWAARIVAAVAPLLSATRGLAGRRGVVLLAASLGIWALEAVVYAAVARAADVPLGVVEALLVVAAANLFALVPAGPGYLGTFDAGVLVALAALGIDGAPAVTYLLLLRFVLFVPITVAGLGVYLAAYAPLPRALQAAARRARA